ncbi:MAG: aminotransferase class IV [Actinobacteria bacterium]|nr:aminotransferase class IV [Actinomycetota bacterium]
MWAYVNGEFVPDDKASISLRDQGFTMGMGVFETWRTYGGNPSRGVVDRCLNRLTKSLNYLEMQTPSEDIVAQVDAATQELVERNQEEIDEHGDVWVWSAVTAGAAFEGFEIPHPTVISYCKPIPIAESLPLEWYDEGVHLISSLLPRSPFTPVDPRVKSISRLAYTRAQRKMQRSGPGHWAVLFDDQGYIAEAVAASLCIVSGDTIMHAPEWTMLPSISLEIFCELGTELGYKVESRPLTMFDYLNADEAYVLACSFAAFPVIDMDGVPLKKGNRVGSQIMKAWVDYVGYDFTKNIHGSAAAGSTGAGAPPVLTAK